MSELYVVEQQELKPYCYPHVHREEGTCRIILPHWLELMVKQIQEEEDARIIEDLLAQQAALVSSGQ